MLNFAKPLIRLAKLQTLRSQTLTLRLKMAQRPYIIWSKSPKASNMSPQSLRVRAHVPKIYTFALKQSLDRYFGANVYTIWVHGDGLNRKSNTPAESPRPPPVCRGLNS